MVNPIEWHPLGRRRGQFPLRNRSRLRSPLGNYRHKARRRSLDLQIAPGSFSDGDETVQLHWTSCHSPRIIRPLPPSRIASPSSAWLQYGTWRCSFIIWPDQLRLTFTRQFRDTPPNRMHRNLMRRKRSPFQLSSREIATISSVVAPIQPPAMILSWVGGGRSFHYLIPRFPIGPAKSRGYPRRQNRPPNGEARGPLPNSYVASIPAFRRSLALRPGPVMPQRVHR